MQIDKNENYWCANFILDLCINWWFTTTIVVYHNEYQWNSDFISKFVQNLRKMENQWDFDFISVLYEEW